MIEKEKKEGRKKETRPIAISRVRLANSDQPTNRPTDRQSGL